MSAWVCGEALIDLLPQGPVPGGGAANTAIALARLGIGVHFIGGISEDEYGRLLHSHLSHSGVDLSHSPRSDLPTALAIVTLNDRGSASYEFRLVNTATFAFDPAALPLGQPEVLHIGSLATVVEPAGSALFDWACSFDCPIVFDPNVRPAVLSDVERYREAVQRWASISSIIKLSDDDLAFLYPGVNEVDALRELMHEDVHAVVLTRGADGLTAITRDGLMNVPGRIVNVIDTVGAGDTVGAVLVEALVKESLEALTGDRLRYVLERAVQAAAITCSRAGCQPPTAQELASGE